MNRIFKWTARRAGGRITVYGVDRDGAKTKVVGVDRIEPQGPAIYAIDKDGRSHELAIGRSS